MPLFKRNHHETDATPVSVSTPETPAEPPLAPAPPLMANGLRDFWTHWDYLLGQITELAEVGVPVLDALGLTLNESIVAPSPLAAGVQAGDELVAQGSRIAPRMLPLLVGLGVDKVMVRPSPRVVVMALSELAGPASYLVAAQAAQSGAKVHRFACALEDPAAVVEAISEQVVVADLIITVGGLNETTLDIRPVAAQIGPADFTPVAISPGRDHGFALVDGKTPMLALPADAYATFVLTKLLVEPIVAKFMGAQTDPELFSAYLAQPLKVTPGIL
ncbi:MAG: hypothetical protein LBV30_09045, partial [Propionibacteriaceae bacterium]|nr:hypothetical protein [Propionibacteriaceae bacterium]